MAHVIFYMSFPFLLVPHCHQKTVAHFHHESLCVCVGGWGLGEGGNCAKGHNIIGPYGAFASPLMEILIFEN